MKHSSWGFGLVLFSVLCASPAMADVSYYVEGGLGIVDTGDFETVINDIYPFQQPMTVATSSNTYINVTAPDLAADDYNIGGNLIVGMKFNRWISVEMMYLKYRDFSANTYQFDDELNSSGNVVRTLGLDIKGSMDASAFGLGVRFDIPLGDSNKYSLFARVHGMEWHDNIQYQGDLIKVIAQGQLSSNADTIRYVNYRSGFAPYVGAGFRYKYSENSSYYVEFNDTEIGKDQSKVKIAGVFIGFRYDFATKGFGSAQTANEKRAEANGTRAITACDPKYKDISGVACE